MKTTILLRASSALLGLAIVSTTEFSTAARSLDGSFQIAQAGGAGGTIGMPEKSVSGKAAPERAATRERGDDRRKARSSRSPGLSGSHDGAWAFVALGPGCAGNGSGVFVVTSGRILGGNLSGSVSPSGAVSAVSVANGLSIRSSGRLSRSSGSGTFRQSDGCNGRWTAQKQ
jgi:hypothetical protein